MEALKSICEVVRRKLRGIRNNAERHFSLAPGRYLTARRFEPLSAPVVTARSNCIFLYISTSGCSLGHRPYLAISIKIDRVEPWRRLRADSNNNA
jgi:hypothetical protein